MTSTPTLRLKKASAYYMVCHQINAEKHLQMQSGVYNVKKVFYGFPWIASKELAMIAKFYNFNGPEEHQTNHDSQTYSRVGNIIIDSIDMFVEKNIIPSISTEEGMSKMQILNKA